jgi:hypothetical protein
MEFFNSSSAFSFHSSSGFSSDIALGISIHAVRADVSFKKRRMSIKE